MMLAMKSFCCLFLHIEPLLKGEDPFFPPGSWQLYKDVIIWSPVREVIFITGPANYALLVEEQKSKHETHVC